MLFGLTTVQRSDIFVVLTASDGQTLSVEQSAAAKQSFEEQPLPPHPNNQRTEKGRVSFRNLILPAPHPMYRPYVLLDEEDKSKRSKSRVGKGSSADLLKHYFVVLYGITKQS